MTTAQFNLKYDAAFLHLLLDLIEISDSFDQLKKLAQIADMLYSPEEEQYHQLKRELERTARHLRRLPDIGEMEKSIR